MNPLSARNFFRHNKRKFISDIIIIVVAICFVYIMECFVQSIVASIRPLDATRFKYSIGIFTTQKVPDIPQATVKLLEYDVNVEGVMPVSVQSITFSVPGSTTHVHAFGIDDSDKEDFFKKFNIKLSSGRLPETGKKEIAIDSNIAMNNRLKVGSHVGSDFNKSQTLEGDYIVVGILENDSHVSLIGSPMPEDNNLKYGQKGYLVFPKEGRYVQAEEIVTPLTRQGYNIWTLQKYNKLYNKNTQTFRILDMMVILSILVMVVCLVCSKYAQYFARKSEIGILNAIGYTRSDIMKKSFREIVITNLTGFIVGLALAILLCRVIVGSAFDNIGGVGVYLYGKAVAMSLFAPLFTTIFTLIPVYRMINRIDAISIIEKN